MAPRDRVYKTAYDRMRYAENTVKNLTGCMHWWSGDVKQAKMRQLEHWKEEQKFRTDFFIEYCKSMEEEKTRKAEEDKAASQAKKVAFISAMNKKRPASTLGGTIKVKRLTKRPSKKFDPDTGMPEVTSRPVTPKWEWDDDKTIAENMIMNGMDPKRLSLWASRR